MMNSRCFSLVVAIFFFFLLISPSFAHLKNQEASAPSPAQSREIPPSPAQSREIPPLPAQSREIPPSPAQSREIPPSPAQSREPPSSPAQSREPPPLRSIFNGTFKMVCAFGDSYTDTGNAQSLGSLSGILPSSGNSPYGSTTFGKPSNRLSDGCLIIDFLCENLGLPSPPPFKLNSADFSQGVNFAIAGATSFSSDFFGKNNNIAQNILSQGAPTSMQTQIEWFKQYQADVCKGKSKSECAAKMEDVLFWVGEVGITDYMRTVRSPSTLRSLRELCLSDIDRLLKVLLESGAKYIVVVGLPPVGCLSLDISQTPLGHLSKMGCSAAVNAAIMIHNRILGKHLDDLRKQYPDTLILYANFWDAYMKIVLNPIKYHFTEAFKACCGATGNKFNFNLSSFCGSPGSATCKDPSKYINWDGCHLTEAMNRLVSDFLLNQGFCQPSFDELIKKKISGIF